MQRFLSFFLMKYPDLLDLIAQGEGEQLDFKFAVNDTKKIAIAICAFANNKGGTLLIGVKDNGKIAGCNAEEEFFMIQAAATMRCRPSAEFKTQTINTPQGQVLVVKVLEGKNKPYSCQDKEGNYKTYFRVKDENMICDRVTRVSLKNSRKNQNQQIKYSPNIDFILKKIEEQHQITVLEIVNILEISKFDAENLLISLVGANLIMPKFLGGGNIVYVTKP